MLFLHSHGAHPSAHKIAIHHTVMGTMAIAAGSCKLLNARSRAMDTRSGWELAWAGLILMIGVQLLIYSE
jgi:putative copper resistance protein D